MSFKLQWNRKTAVIALILVIGIFAGYKIFSRKNDGYIFDTVQKRDITEMVSDSGIVDTSARVSIYSPANGLISQVYVTNGDEVHTGQKLFSVRSTATSQEKAAALAAYQAAKSAVQEAENNRRNTQAIVDRVHDDLKNHETDETFTQKETRTAAEVAHDNAYDALLAAQAQLESAQTDYQATLNATVSAPVSGLISNLAAATGSGVTVNSLLTPASPVLIITGLGETEIKISVGETDINKIRTGQDADIKLDAVENKIYRGKVNRFDENGTVSGGVVKFNVYIQIIDPDNHIKSGMTADVDINTNKLSGVLSVPNIAVKPYQRGRAVRKLGSNRQVEYIPVKIGVKGKDYTQIIEGLTEGEKILVSLTNEKAPRTNPLGL